MIRKILIYSSSRPRIPKSILKDLTIRNTVIEYVHISIIQEFKINSNTKSNSRTRLELYGYDGSLKYEVKNIFTLDQLIKVLKTCIAKIDKMLMGSLEIQERQIQNHTQHNTKPKLQTQKTHNTTRENLLRKCGLPDIQETSHCFADNTLLTNASALGNTHHTCCMLGSKAREYADASGNPIGSLSSKVQAIKNPSRTSKNIRKSKKVLTPWCTCTGSKVCTYYTDKFGTTDGTHIKFIGTLPSNDKNPDDKNEEKAISKLDIYRHKTPGIISL